VVGNDHIDKYDPFSKDIIKPKGDIKSGEFSRGQGGILNHLGRPGNQFKSLASLEMNEIDSN
jgi:hypothetical protein